MNRDELRDTLRRSEDVRAFGTPEELGIVCSNEPAYQTVVEILHEVESAPEPLPAAMRRRLLQACAVIDSLFPHGPPGSTSVSVIVACARRCLSEGIRELAEAGPRTCACPGCRDEAVLGRALCPYCDDAPFHHHCGTCGCVAKVAPPPEAYGDPSRRGSCAECGGGLVPWPGSPPPTGIGWPRESSPAARIEPLLRLLQAVAERCERITAACRRLDPPKPVRERITRTIERAQWDAVSFKKHLEHLLTLLGPAAQLPAGKDSADVLQWLSEALHKTRTFLNPDRWSSIALCVEDTIGCVGSTVPQTASQGAREECRALEPLLEAVEVEITRLASTAQVPGPR